MTHVRPPLMELWLHITSLGGYRIPESELIFDQVHRGFYEIKDDMCLLCSLPSVLWTIISFCSLSSWFVLDLQLIMIAQLSQHWSVSGFGWGVLGFFLLVYDWWSWMLTFFDWVFLWIFGFSVDFVASVLSLVLWWCYGSLSIGVALSARCLGDSEWKGL